jgi:membrane protein
MKMNRSVKKVLKKVAFKKVAKSSLPLVDFLILFFKQVQVDNINSKANAMAFNFMMAIFPGIIFLFTLIPYFPIPNLQEQLIDFLSDAIPNSIYAMLRETIEDIISKPRGGLLSFGFIFALYAAMNGTLSMMNSFDECYKSSEKKRGFFQGRLTALILTLINALVLIVSVSILLLGEQVLDYLYTFHQISQFNYYLLLLVRYVTAIFSFFLLTAVIYYFAPSVHTRWSFFSFGAFVATALNILVTVAFSIYLSNFATYNKLYGSIGTIIALMLWLYLTSIVLLIGFEMNAVLEMVKDDEKAQKEKA